MSLQNEIAKMSKALSLNVSTTENEIMKQLRKDIREGVISIKDNLAKLNEELIDKNELQVKLDELTNQFHTKYDDFKQKIIVIKQETEEGIAGLQTELETTGNEVKTNTAEKIRIAESLDILSEQLASNTVGRSLVTELKAAKRRLETVNSDLVSLIAGNENEIVKLQRVVGGEAPMTTNLDMGGYRILNVAQLRDPSKKKDFESVLVTDKFLYDYMSKVNQNYMIKDRDGSLDGRLNMSNHRISGLANPTDADDAVTRRYVASRFQVVNDEVQGDKRKLDALQNLFGVENNQVLIREYEIIGTDFGFLGSIHLDEGGRFVGPWFRKYPYETDDLNDFRFIDIFTLKE